mgnify:CR=1 FL=1
MLDMLLIHQHIFYQLIKKTTLQSILALACYRYLLFGCYKEIYAFHVNSVIKQ